MQEQLLHSFYFASDLKTYENAASLIAQGIVPLIAPSSAKRLSRWIQVLNWYGLKSVKNFKLSTPQTHKLKQGNPIIAIGRDFAVPAKFYAEVCGRPFLIVEKGEISQLIKAHSYQSLLVVAPAEVLTLDVVRFLSNQIFVPWGILTAPDVAALTFVVAKLLAGMKKVEGKRGLIDVPASIVQELKQAGTLSARVLISQNMVRTLLSKRDWHTLAILAHGESAHVDLNDVVLCGLIGDVEHGGGGYPINGCRVDGKVRHCKRVHNPDTNILSFGDIKAMNLYLFSCLSYALNHGLYPSDLSTIHSIVEGYPMMALLTDRVLNIDVLSLVIILALCRQNVGLGAAIQLENDLASRQNGSRPFILFGDPFGPAPSWSKVDANGSFHTMAEQNIWTLWLDQWSGVKITEIETPRRNMTLIMGKQTAIVIPPKNYKAKHIMLTDQTEKWRYARNWFKVIGQRLNYAAWLERAIIRLYKPQISNSTDFQDGIDNLTRLRMQLEGNIQEALYVCESIRRKGVWNSVLVQWKDLCSINIKLWDRQLATLVKNSLLSGDLHEAMVQGFVMVERQAKSTCDFCSSQLAEERFESPVENQSNLFRTNCPSCGNREVWVEDGTRLLFDLPTHLCPDTIINIAVNLYNSQGEDQHDTLEGVLVTELVDKGTGEVVFHQLETVKRYPHTLSIDVPANIAPELHTLKLCWIQGLYMTYQRRRCPAYTVAF